MLSTAV